MKTRNELRPQLFWIGIALGAALLSRAPFAFADRPYHDEPVYAFVGASWLNGILPYRDLWDIKPPGLFALYALVQSMGAAPFASIWILALAAACASVLGLCALGKAWFGDLRIGAIAGVLFAWFSLASGGMRGPAVFLASPFVIWGLCFVRDSGTFKVHDSANHCIRGTVCLPACSYSWSTYARRSLAKGFCTRTRRSYPSAWLWGALARARRASGGLGGRSLRRACPINPPWLEFSRWLGG